jgi:hypothetical protein
MAIIRQRSMPPRRTTMAPRTQGLDAKVVRVTQITERESAICEDLDGGLEFEVPLMPQRAKGGLPQVGERWVLDRSLGRWQFSWIVRSQGAYNSPFEVVEALPAASEGRRGQIVLLAASDGVADTLQICLKSAADTYSWKVLQTG